MIARVLMGAALFALPLLSTPAAATQYRVSVYPDSLVTNCGYGCATSDARLFGQLAKPASVKSGQPLQFFLGNSEGDISSLKVFESPALWTGTQLNSASSGGFLAGRFRDSTRREMIWRVNVAKHGIDVFVAPAAWPALGSNYYTGIVPYAVAADGRMVGDFMNRNDVLPSGSIDVRIAWVSRGKFLEFLPIDPADTTGIRLGYYLTGIAMPKGYPIPAFVNGVPFRTTARAINFRGRIVGAAQERPVYWDLTERSDRYSTYRGVPSPCPDRVLGEAVAVSSSGEVVGNVRCTSKNDYLPPPDGYSAFYWSGDPATKAKTVPALPRFSELLWSEAKSVNDHGVVVGYGHGILDGQKSTKAFIWDTKTGIVSLIDDALAKESSQFEVFYAELISNNGDIVAQVRLRQDPLGGKLAVLHPVRAR